ncbi:cGMP-inhibited 3',5'-cyclic phosphodiesterase B [Manis javanica]|nr:cGMP-inhibited 3',5'-cyclic phosphodiesterase B [Manis javanica]
MMQSPTILVLLITTTVLSHQPAPPPAKSRHFPWNYTWVVLSERGDVVWSRSQTSPDVWWPNVLQPDLCKLALGAGAPWGVEHLFEQSEAPFIPRAGR